MDNLESLYIAFAKRGDEIENLRKHLERAQGAEADLANMLLRVERAEALSARLHSALTDLVQCHAEGGFVQPDDEVLNAARCALMPNAC